MLADFTSIHLAQSATDRVQVTGGEGRPRPSDYKVSIGVREGVLAEGQISYAGPGALQRANLARDILEKRLASGPAKDLCFEMIGLHAMHGARWPAMISIISSRSTSFSTARSLKAIPGRSVSTRLERAWAAA